jgi:hypothetical protein
MIQTLIKKKLQNLSSYKDLEMEISRLWKVRIKTVPVIPGALGTIKKGLRSEPPTAARSPVGHTGTKDHTNEYYTHHL